MIRRQRSAGGFVTTEGEDGAILIMALVFLLVVGLTIVALAGFATTAETNTTALHSEINLSADAQSAVSAAMQQVRVNFNYNPSGGVNTSLLYNQTNVSVSDPSICSASWAESAYSLRVYCVGFQTANAEPTRTVDFYVCGTSVTFSNCVGCPSSGQCAENVAAPAGSLVMFAEANYNDVPPGAPGTVSCSSLSTSTCGLTMSVSAWDLRLSD